MKQRLTVEIIPDPENPNDKKADHIVTAKFEIYEDTVDAFLPWYFPYNIAVHFLSKLDQFDFKLNDPEPVNPFQGTENVASIWRFRIPYTYFSQ